MFQRSAGRRREREGPRGVGKAATRRSALQVFPTFLVSFGLALYAGAMALLHILPLPHLLLLTGAGGLAWFCLLVSIVPIVEWTRERLRG